MYTVTQLALIGSFLLLQGFFSGSEMAMVSANRAKLEARAGDGGRGAQLALRLLSKEEQLLGTCLIGTNICLVAGTTLVANLLINHGLPQEWLATAAFVPFGLLLGEALPKLLYKYHADTLVSVLAFPLTAAQVLFMPLLLVVSAWAHGLKKVTGGEREVSREEIVALLEEDGRGGDIDPADRQLISRMLAMTETTVEDAMTPLVDVVAYEDDSTVAELAQAVDQFGHSRFPIFRERVDNIIGLVEHRGLLHLDDADTIESIIQPVTFVPETKRTHELLYEMRDRGEHMVAVVDEYGGTVGVVTVEDLLEEMVGEIRDERDTEEPAIKRLSPREWRIPARSEIDEVASIIGRPLPEGPYETVAGLILAAVGRIPETGEVVKTGRMTWLIEQANERSIQVVRLTLPADPGPRP